MGPQVPTTTEPYMDHHPSVVKSVMDIPYQGQLEATSLVFVGSCTIEHLLISAALAEPKDFQFIFVAPIKSTNFEFATAFTQKSIKIVKDLDLLVSLKVPGWSFP